METEVTRPIPELDSMTREFWTGGVRGKLRITTCESCGRLFHPPAPICPYCGDRRISWSTVSGAGVVDSFTVVRRPWIGGYETPYVVARVRLQEERDAVLVSNLVDVEPEQVRIGMEVQVVFEPRGDVHVPVFRPSR